MTSTKFSILGAGNGGQSLAADLVSRGFHVAALYDRFPGPIEDVRTRGGVEMLGQVARGFARLDLATTDIGEAIAAADVLFVVVPSFAHQWMAENMAPYLRDGQVILIMPGYFGGALLFDQVFREKGVRAEVTLAEAISIPYATRLTGPAQVGIKRTKKVLFMAALPSSKTQGVLEILGPALPQLSTAESVLVTGMNNVNPIGHIPAYLLNLGRVESLVQTEHFNWHDWVTPGIRKVTNAIDQERCLVGRALAVPCYTQEEINEMWYAGELKKIVSMTGKIPESSETIPPRYITEDVPNGLVPTASLGRLLGVETPATDSLITLASVIQGVDYWAEGRTVERLGLAGLTPAQIRARVG